MRNFSTALVACASIVVSALAAAPPAAAQADPTRILLLGDSVTHGFEGEHTWRFFADRSLDEAGASVDFVGPHAGTWSDEDQFGGAYADPDFDTDHAARFGLSMFETLYYPAESAPAVTELMEADTEIMVLTLGFNDLVGINQQPETTIGHARRIISQARAVNPGVDVVLFALPQVWYDRVSDYNAILPELAGEMSSETSRVVVTPTAPLELGVDTYDAAHPTTQGQEKIAAAVVASLDELGAGVAPEPEPEPVPVPDTEPEPEPEPVVSPAAPTATSPVGVPTQGTAPVAEPVVAAGAPRRVKARLDGRRTVVTWRTGARADHSLVRCGSVRRETTRHRLVVRARARSCQVRSVNEAGASRWVRARIRR